MAEDTPAPVESVNPFYARGAGGTVFTFDELVPGTSRAELLAAQIRKGQLVLLDAPDGIELPAVEVEDFLAPVENIDAAVKITRPGRDAPRQRTIGDAPAGDTRADGSDSVDPTGIPTGSIDTVCDWVFEVDELVTIRATTALEAELAKGDDARKTLVERLEGVIAAAAPADEIIVPDGTVDELLDWIEESADQDEQLARAQAALKAERAKDDPDADFVEQLLGYVPA